MNLDFSSIDFRPVTAEERISKCRAMAEECQMQANGRDGEMRQRYLLLAKYWAGCAEELKSMLP